jgi:hypothetical protein
LAVEILVIIIAFWLILVGGYGGMTLLNGSHKHPAARRVAPPAPRVRISSEFAQQPLPGAPASTQLGGLFSEVDLLRAQVEHLRTEVVALSDVATRHEKPRTRRYRTGVYSDLPRLLRRQVKEVRNIRHPLGV